MRVEDLIVYGKSKVHSEHAKMLLAALLNVNSLELLNYLDKEVPEDVEKALTLKKLIPSLTMTLVDISDNALEMARKNQEEKGLDVSIIKSNFLEEVPGTFDIIVSNPPYIKEGEEIEEIVKENEPSIALYGGPDGLDSYRTILHQCKEKLNPKFMIAFEIGCNQREAITQLIYQELGDVRVICKKDLSNRDRMIFIFSK